MATTQSVSDGTGDEAAQSQPELEFEQAPDDSEPDQQSEE
jgi:hypothetical protein